MTKAEQKQYDDLKANLSDRWWRLNNLYYIVNEKGEKIKFQFNDVQEFLFNNLWYLNLILKSRQHGITTFMCIYFLDVCLFNSNIRAGIIAHHLDDAEAFFTDKVKFAYDNLPEALRSLREATTDRAKELKFSNNSSIRIRTSFRSGNLQYLHISEFGKICRKRPDDAKEIVTGALNAVHAGQSITIESTAEGREGYFYDYCMEAEKLKLEHDKLTQLDFKYFFFPWHEDPRNQLQADGIVLPQSLTTYFTMLGSKDIKLSDAQKAWYAKKWKTQGEDMYREHPSFAEEAFKGALQGVYFKSQFNKIYKENRITTFPVEYGIPVDTWWDIGVSDHTSIWFTQNVERKIHVIDYYEWADEGLPFYAKILKEKDYQYGEHVLPHDGSVKEWGSGQKRLAQAKRYLGKHVRLLKRTKKSGDASQIEAGRTILQYCMFHKKNCVQQSRYGKKSVAVGINSLESYRKEWNDKLGCYHDYPLHDWASNGADAFMVMAVAHRFSEFHETINHEVKPSGYVW